MLCEECSQKPKCDHCGRVLGTDIAPDAQNAPLEAISLENHTMSQPAPEQPAQAIVEPLRPAVTLDDEPILADRRRQSVDVRAPEGWGDVVKQALSAPIGWGGVQKEPL